MLRNLRRLAVQLACSVMLLAGAAAQAPHLTGSINIDLPRGILAGNVCLANLPGQATPAFLLNHGLNIKSVRDASGGPAGYSGYYNGTLAGEGMQYTLNDPPSGPRTVCVSYTGAFPVYANNQSTFEFKGLIALIAHTFRASEQSKWYPVFYDTGTGRPYPAVTYSLTIHCPACTAIYVNGAPPRHTPHGVFASQVPRPLFIFAGRFAFSRVGRPPTSMEACLLPQPKPSGPPFKI